MCSSLYINYTPIKLFFKNFWDRYVSEFRNIVYLLIMHVTNTVVGSGVPLHKHNNSEPNHIYIHTDWNATANSLTSFSGKIFQQLSLPQT